MYVFCMCCSKCLFLETNGLFLSVASLASAQVEEQLLGGTISSPSDLRLPGCLSPSSVFTEDEDRLLLWGLYEQGVNAFPLVHAAVRGRDSYLQRGGRQTART